MTQFVTVDGLVDIYVPLVTKRWYLGIYFVLVFWTVSVLIMNLIMAVIVDDTIARSQMDDKMQLETKKRQYLKMVPHVKAAFEALDENKSGFVSKEEVMNADFR